jgi:predicted hydrolase (HD superfamily)
LVNGLLFNTIEWRKDKNKVYLHKILDDLDYQFDLDDFDEETKKEIYYFLIRNFFN